MNLTTLFSDVLAQLRSNRRLTIMVAGIAAVLFGLFVDTALDYRKSQSTELQALAERRDRLHTLSGSTEWFNTARDATEALAALEAGLPTTRSPGLAQALFQGWLRERTAGMDGSVFTEVGAPQVLEDIEGISGLVRVTGKVAGRSHRNTVIDLIRRAEASSSLITVDDFSIPAESDSGFSVTFSAYFRIESESTEAGV